MQVNILNKSGDNKIISQNIIYAYEILSSSINVFLDIVFFDKYLALSWIVYKC